MMRSSISPNAQDFFSGDFEYILNMVDVLNETATHDPRMHVHDLWNLST